MLNHLSIRNYALIDNLNINLPSGMITMTGETGAGKSIILGALKLVLGERADLKSLKNPEEKCFIEADFKLDKNTFLDFFTIHDLDFEENTLIRREILPSGKSRAFINDTPVTLDILQQLSKQLIDIHSQFETAELLSEKFQLNLLDHFSGLQSDLKDYQIIYNQFVSTNKDLKNLEDKLQLGTQDLEYNKFLLEELEKLELENINLIELEKELDLMKNSEYLAQILSETQQILNNEEIGVLNQIHEVNSRLDKGAQVSDELEKLSVRVNSIKVELQDISSETEDLLEKIEFNPVKYEEYNQKINLINSLLQKHKVSEINELIEIRDYLAKNTSDLTNLESDIEKLKKQIQKFSENLTVKSEKLHKQRVKQIPILEAKVLEILCRLGMEKSQIKIDISTTNNFTFTGTDKVTILFSANTGKEVQPIAKAISGGERSRVMLAIKKIMAENEALPTLILDEIDTGVSGRIANEMGKLMQEMAQTMQLITITHLPQVAAKGATQFKVEKNEINHETITEVRLLTNEERIDEIAQLISGSDITETARQQAMELFKS